MSEADFRSYALQIGALCGRPYEPAEIANEKENESLKDLFRVTCVGGILRRFSSMARRRMARGATNSSVPLGQGHTYTNLDSGPETQVKLDHE